MSPWLERVFNLYFLQFVCERWRGDTEGVREGAGDVAGGSSHGGQLKRPRWHSWYCYNRCCLNNFIGAVDGKQGFVWAGAQGGCVFCPWLTSTGSIAGSSSGCQVKLLPPEQALPQTCSVQGGFPLCGNPTDSKSQKWGRTHLDSTTPQAAPWFLTTPSSKLLFGVNCHYPSLLNFPQMMFNWGTN